MPTNLSLVQIIYRKQLIVNNYDLKNLFFFTFKKMATIEEIREKSKMVEEEYKKADKRLEDWKKGRYEGEWLNDLEKKLDNGEYRDEKQEKRWEKQIDELKKEKERLEKNVDDWKKQVEEWGKALRDFGKGEGNKQIA